MCYINKLWLADILNAELRKLMLCAQMHSRRCTNGKNIADRTSYIEYPLSSAINKIVIETWFRTIPYTVHWSCIQFIHNADTVRRAAGSSYSRCTERMSTQPLGTHYHTICVYLSWISPHVKEFMLLWFYAGWHLLKHINQERLCQDETCVCAGESWPAERAAAGGRATSTTRPHSGGASRGAGVEFLSVHSNKCIYTAFSLKIFIVLKQM